jgi:hypothetical protein
MKRFVVSGLLLSALFAADVQACPPLPSTARLQALAEQDELDGYTLLRVLKCGWREAEPAVRAWRESVRAAPGEEEDTEESLIEPFIAATRVNPAFIRKLLDEPLDEDDAPAEVMALARMPQGQAAQLRHFEQSLAPAIAWLRKEAPLTPAQELQLELSLAAQEIRRGQLDQARAHVEKAAADWEALETKDEASDSARTEASEALEEFRAVLALPAAQSLATTSEPWTLDRSSWLRRCGFSAAMAEVFGTAYLRELVLRHSDPDLAISELLAADWRDQIHGSPEHAEFLATLLRKRYSAQELRQGWDDALASLRNEDAVTGLSLFGHFLPLPSAVRERADNPGDLPTERRLRDEELVEMVRNTPLYKALNPQ